MVYDCGDAARWLSIVSTINFALRFVEVCIENCVVECGNKIAQCRLMRQLDQHFQCQNLTSLFSTWYNGDISIF